MGNNFDAAKQSYYLCQSAIRKERRTIKRERVAMIREAHRQFIVNQALNVALDKVKRAGAKAQWCAMQAGY